MQATSNDLEQYVTVPKLKERGWTDTLIRKHLGEPDSFKRNPVYRSAAPMRLYRMERVQSVENSEMWATLQQHTDSRKQSAEKAVQTKVSRLLQQLESLVIVVPQLPAAELLQAACVHYNRRQGYQSATPNSDPAFLERITVNYLRHVLTTYEDELAKTFGKVGVRKAELEIRQKVYGAIAIAYPDLSSECDLQLLKRRGFNPVWLDMELRNQHRPER